MTGVEKVAMLGCLFALGASGLAFGQESAERVQVLDSMLRPKELADIPLPQSVGSVVEFFQQTDVTVLNKWLKDIRLSGFLDVGYTENLNNPRSPQNNVDRSFDTQSNSFMINMAELMFERVSTADSVAGFRLKLGMGKDAGVLASTENWGGGSPVFDVVEAYVEFLAPIGKGLDFKIGKFATLAGYEVIEAKDNFNYSRSLLFTYAIPLTHTGIRATYPILDQLSVTAGVVEGWNVVVDNNPAKTGEFQLNANPTDWISALVTAYYGAEQPTVGGHTPGDKRTVIDAVGTVTWNNLKIGLNYDWGSDEGGGALVSTPGKTDWWSGTAVYLRYQWTRWFAPTLRLERFMDKHGQMSNFSIANQGVTAVGKTRVNEATLSTDIKINDNLMFRLEYRHDWADEKIFLEDNDLRGKKSQNTFAGEVIFQF